MTDSRVDDIAAIERLRASGLVAADVDVLDRITDADYVHVEANGQERDKRGFLAAISGGIRFSRYDLHDNLIRVYDMMAVVTGSFSNEMIRPDGERVARAGRHCRVYVLRAEGWRNILHQGTATGT